MSQAWWPMPLIPALARQRQADHLELETYLVYKASSRTTRAAYISRASSRAIAQTAI